MFGGSVNIPSYDTHVERVGGENNAFTSNDITNYYLSLPFENIETAFWLESDRMLGLAFYEKSLEVQRNVVIEEFKQRYLNQPYGDIWLLLRPLAYKTHPYRWPTIGMDVAHIENAGMEDVKAFYRKFYNPSNAILSVAGNIDTETVFRRAEHWFGVIRNEGSNNRKLPEEPTQDAPRRMEVTRNVPYDGIYKAWHMCPRLHPDYFATDLLSDIFSNGNSSRLYQRLVKEKRLFSDISAFITGDLDPGLFIISGKLIGGVTIEQAEEAIAQEVDAICNGQVSDVELEKVKNKAESTLRFSEINVLDKAMNLAYYELLGDAGIYNRVLGDYRQVGQADIMSAARTLFNSNNCSTLIYRAGGNSR
jgi:predicted Zn-dependent peptidase